MYSRKAWGGSVDPFILTKLARPNAKSGRNDTVVSVVVFEWADEKLIGTPASPESGAVRIFLLAVASATDTFRTTDTVYLRPPGYLRQTLCRLGAGPVHPVPVFQFFQEPYHHRSPASGENNVDSLPSQEDGLLLRKHIRVQRRQVSRDSRVPQCLWRTPSCSDREVAILRRACPSLCIDGRRLGISVLPASIRHPAGPELYHGDSRFPCRRNIHDVALLRLSEPTWDERRRESPHDSSLDPFGRP